jgi:hypothetical protein
MDQPSELLEAESQQLLTPDALTLPKPVPATPLVPQQGTVCLVVIRLVSLVSA